MAQPMYWNVETQNSAAAASCLRMRVACSGGGVGCVWFEWLAGACVVRLKSGACVVWCPHGSASSSRSVYTWKSHEIAICTADAAGAPPHAGGVVSHAARCPTHPAWRETQDGTPQCRLCAWYLARLQAYMREGHAHKGETRRAPCEMWRG